MAILKDHKRESLAQAMVAGKSARDCCTAAGFKYSPSQFSHLKKEQQIIDRIKELQSAAVTENIMGLTERLELLTEMARDVTIPRGIRLRALFLLHEQSGDSVQKSDINITGDLQNNVQVIEVALPQIVGDNRDNDKEVMSGSELDDLASFLRD